VRNLIDEIRKGRVLVGDGAMGTMLIARGLKPGEPPESFNLKHIAVIEDIARQYLDAGADIVQTNTFGGSPLNLAVYGLDERTVDINRAAVQAVKEVVDDRGYVSGSCGPSGRLLKPYGDVDPDTMFASFERQMVILIDAGVDVVCVETMSDIQEAQLAIKAARVVSKTVPVMATMTFNPTPKGFYTIMGTNIPEAAAALEKAGADIIGSNCGNGIENMILIAKEFKQYTTLPLIIQSNAGLPQKKGDAVIYPETPEFMAEKAQTLLQAGVSIIGGCCGTTPQHIRAFRQMVDAKQKNTTS
jgi:5-methyltetrahydrofolate--homocysteine methyltransferase